MVEQAQLNTCGQYKIIRTLGEGGNAVVKLVEQNGVQSAMKIFVKENLRAEDADRMIAKAKSEYDIVKDIKSDLIMQYLDFQESAIWTNSKGVNKEVCFLVMELLEGVELLEFLNECQDQEDSFVRYMFIEIGKGIHHLHKAGIAHRDIKPENIMITKDYKLKIIDLGYGLTLAGRKQDGYTNTRLGTPMYMAPEIFDKTVPYQGQDADLFAFGVSLFVGKVIGYPWKKPNPIEDDKYNLFAGDSGQNAEQFWEEYSDRELSTDYKSLIESILAKEPSSRPTMADILGHKWMKGRKMSQQEFEAVCKQFMDVVIKEKSEMNEEFGIDHAVEKKARRGQGNQWIEENKNQIMERQIRDVQKWGYSEKVRQFSVSDLEALDVLSLLNDTIRKMDMALSLADENWQFRIESIATQKQEKLPLLIEIHRVTDNANKYVVSLKGIDTENDNGLDSIRSFKKNSEKFINAIKEENDDIMTSGN